VILLGVTPTMRDGAAHCIEAGKIADCGITRAEFDALREPIRKRLLAAAVNYPRVEYLDPTEFFCTNEICPLMRDGYSLYTDTHHVSATAASDFAALHLAREANQMIYEKRPGKSGQNRPM